MRAAAVLLGILGLAACGEPDAETHSPIQVLEAANTAKDRAMVVGDPAALENFYTADYHFVGDDGEVRDKATQVKSLTEDVDVLAADSSDVEVRALSKNAALVTGRLRAKYRRGGEDFPVDQHYTRVWITQDSQWRLRHEHMSAVKPPR